MPTAKEDPTKTAVAELKKRGAEALLQVATPQWLRAYMRAHPHKTFEHVMSKLPNAELGTLDNPLHAEVVHSIARSPLDGPPSPAAPLPMAPVIEGELVPTPSSE